MRDSFRAFQTSFLCLSVPLSVSRNEPAAAIKPGAPGEERRPPAAQWRPVNTIQQVRTAFTVVLNPDCEVRATGAVVSPCNSSDQKLNTLIPHTLIRILSDRGRSAGTSFLQKFPRTKQVFR